MSPAKRRKKSASARLRPFWVLFVLLAIGAGTGAYYAATWTGFYPKSVTVSGNRIVPSSEILARASIAQHANVWMQNMGAAARRIEAIPYVKNARIGRSLPASVHITVTERTPFAVLQTGASRLLVDRDLRVLRFAEPAAGSLPVIIAKLAAKPGPGVFIGDADVRQLRDDYATLARAHVAVHSLRYDRFGDLVAVTPGGIDLLLGDDGDLQKKAPLVDPIISQVGASGRKMAAVDLRAPKTPVVVYKQK